MVAQELVIQSVAHQLLTLVAVAVVMTQTKVEQQVQVALAVAVLAVLAVQMVAQALPLLLVEHL